MLVSLVHLEKRRFLLILGNAEPVLWAELVLPVRHHSGWKRGRLADLPAHSQAQVHWRVLTGARRSRYQFCKRREFGTLEIESEGLGERKQLKATHGRGSSQNRKRNFHDRHRKQH